MTYKRVDFTKKFTKQFQKLSTRHKTAFYVKLELWQDNPHDKSLRDHALKGRYVGYRSIDVAPDLRALYYSQGDTIIIFALVGTHSQLYEK
jgi:mRNA interferase YafQ